MALSVPAQQMFLHPLCCGIAVACESHKKRWTPQIQFDGASCLVSDKWGCFLKEDGVAASVDEISWCNKDTNEVWFSAVVKLP